MNRSNGFSPVLSSTKKATSAGLPVVYCWDRRRSSRVGVDNSRSDGKAIARLDVSYDQPGSAGGYSGYIDDIAISS